MLPYEILVGLRGSIRTSACNFIGKQKLFRQLNIDVQSLCNVSTYSSKSKYNSRLVYKDLSISDIKRFHTEASVYYQAHLNDSTEKDSEEEFQQSVDRSGGLQNSVEERNLKKSESSKSINKLQNVSEGVKKWLFSDLEKVPLKEIERKFPEPKAFLHNFFTLVSNEISNPHCLTSTANRSGHKKSQTWHFTYEIQWPEKKSFSSTSHSKASASISAALKILHWLDLNGRIEGRFPVIYEKNERRSLLNAPEKLEIEEKVLGNIEDFLNKYEKELEEAIAKNQDKDSEKFVSDDFVSKRHPISNNYVDINNRNESLLQRLNERTMLSNPELPIFQYKDQILKELEENQAVVIKGDTGCGKTTQVPQFIMDYFTAKGQATDCSMIVTQPRRISAISLAERIAFERSERVGDVVGYQVRLQQMLPRQRGAILFSTTGILLKKLQTNLKLEGCSHIVVDEAHERSVDTDMLLVLLKRAMKMNPSLKVVIMSATINADLFQEYLGCNAVDVPGRLFPVKMHFLEDIDKVIPASRKRFTQDCDDGPDIDTDRIINLIRWISENKPPGSILCFLPGWSQILRIQTNLEEYSNSRQIVIPLHSKIPHADQSKIFNPPPDGVRKIILATDIAETGITVPDVVYVIDSACHKEKRWHENKGLSTIDTHWISKANINQRKGRAGRVQEGESYHFITKQQYKELNPYPVPEVLRVSLEKTVLDGKTYSNESAESFFGSMPQPPRISAVKKAVEDLQILGALNYEQDLTGLGKRIAMFAIHPKLSKAMVYATIFQCISPITTVAAALSFDSEIFYGVLDNKSRIRETKQHFHPTSDHLSIAWIYNQWLDHFNQGPHNSYRFSRRNGLHAERMNILHKIRDINLEALRDSGMIKDIRDGSHLNSEENQFAVLDELARGILLSGMDQILKHRNFEIRKGRLTKSGTSMVTEDDAKAQLSPECVNYKSTSFPSPYFTYYQKTHHQESRMTLIRESSMLSPVTVLLFSQGRVTGAMDRDENTDTEKVLLQIDGKKNVHLSCDEHTARTLLRFRDLMWSVVRYYVEKNANRKDLETTNYEMSDVLDNVKQEMMTVLASLLSSASKGIDEEQDSKTSRRNYAGNDYSILNRSDEDYHR